MVNVILFAALGITLIYCKLISISADKGLKDLLINGMFFFIGSLSCILYDLRIYPDFYVIKQSKYIKIRINSDPIIKQNIILFDAIVTKSVNINSSLPNSNVKIYQFYPSSGQIRVNLLKNVTDRLELKYGEELLICAKVKQNEAPQNPSEYNYKAWLATQNIYHNIFLKQGEWIRLNINTGHKFIRFTLDLREQLVSRFRTLLKNDDAFSIAATLILGYRADLNTKTLAIFVKTGTVHVLSVSGMHVALVYLILDRILFFFSGKQILKVLKTIAIVSMIWFYTFLTGFSPSVLRAAIMISAFIIAKLVSKPINSYNITAFAAFTLLIHNPFLIWNAGFQLSFLAVFGLIYLQPKIKNLLHFRSLWLTRVWNAIAVSLAAQLATYPLSVYYFHQFPLYFLPSNLFIILPAALIMYLGIIILIFRLEALGELFEWLIILLISGLTSISKLPYSSIPAIWLSKLELTLLCLALALFIISMNKPKKRLLLCSITIFLAFQVLTGISKIQAVAQHKIIRFNLKKNYAVALLQGQQAILITDVKPESKTFNYSIKPALEQHRITDILFKEIP